jgi:hypothetical protein
MGSLMELTERHDTHEAPPAPPQGVEPVPACGPSATVLSGVATVLEVRAIDVAPDELPMVEVDLQVEVAGRAPYVASVRELAAPVMQGGALPGTAVPARVHSANPCAIVLDWFAAA